MANPSPTVGRVVWVFLADHGDASHDSSKAVPGLITYVNEDGTIDVGGFTRTGTFIRNGVPLEPVEISNGDYAVWMPYQKAVASGDVVAIASEISKHITEEK